MVSEWICDEVNEMRRAFERRESEGEGEAIVERRRGRGIIT